MIKIFAMDVDGTLTDGKINITDTGEIFKSFNVKDGLGIKMLKENNIIPIIITGRKSKIVLKRAEEIGIEQIYQNVLKKEDCLQEICINFNVSCKEITYIGDDVNDLEIMKRVGYSFAPADASDEVLKFANYICSKKGGEGAVREAIELIVNNKEM